METIEEIINEISSIRKQIMNLQNIIFEFDDTKINDNNCICLVEELNEALNKLLNAKEKLKEINGEN